MSLCLIVRFKNERHIMYEFIHHYLEEGVDCFILIDDNSNDNYLELNRDWMDDLIKSQTIIIKKAKKAQKDEYDLHLDIIRKFKWVLLCDMDEFFYSVPPDSSIKSVLNSRLSKYDYIRIPWKIYKHDCYHQPKSIIDDNLSTHTKKLDTFAPTRGYKYIVKSEVIKSLGIHSCKEKHKSKTLCLKNCHNSFIHINHYRTQSEEYLRGVKEVRGGGVHKNKYKSFSLHKKNIYNKKCELLRNKRKDLIEKCLAREQIKPKIYSTSSFYNEINKELPLESDDRQNNTSDAKS